MAGKALNLAAKVADMHSKKLAKKPHASVPISPSDNDGDEQAPTPAPQASVELCPACHQKLLGSLRTKV